MKIWRTLLAVGAVVCGVSAMGCDLLLSLGASHSGWTIAVMYGSALSFVALSAASAYLCERKRNARAIVCKCLFLIGVFGLLSLALCIAVLGGAVMEVPEVMILLTMSICFVVFFRLYQPKEAN